ncbi:MAG: hypothetical protein JXR97_10995 [Planctomycetes bacterium]|nr:hypothetical protein [Planctomycetota bacterium]
MGRYLICFLFAILACPALFGGDASLDGPELEDFTVNDTATDKNQTGLSREDFLFVEKMLEAKVAAGTADKDEIEKLRRLRNIIRAQLTQIKVKTDQEKELYSKMVAMLQKNVGKAKDARSARDALAMFYLFADQPEKAIELLRKNGPASSSDIYHELKLAYTNLRLGDYRESGRNIEKARDIIRTRLPLLLSEPAFCDTITAFRLYTPISKSSFNPGDTGLIYLEIAGSEFKTDATGKASCNLNFGLAIKDEMQEVVWEKADYGQWAQTYQGPLRDLHVSITMRIPNNLPDGKYHIFVTCKDVFSGRTGISSSDFMVGSSTAEKTKTTPKKQEKYEPDDAKKAAEKELQEKSFEEELRRIRERQKQSDEAYRRNADILHWEQ